MLHGEAFGLLVGAVALGAVHGIEPGHGWPVAASYALDQSNKWLYGFAASFIHGVDHLVSSIAMVGVFFFSKGYFELTQVNEPITILGGVQIGGPSVSWPASCSSRSVSASTPTVILTGVAITTTTPPTGPVTTTPRSRSPLGRPQSRPPQA